MAKIPNRKKKRPKLTTATDTPEEVLAAVVVATPVVSDATLPPTKEVPVPERDIQMLRDWVGGMSKQSVADKHGVTRQTVVYTSKKNNWDKLRTRYNKEMHQRAIQIAVKQKVAAARMLDKDMIVLGLDVNTTNRQLTKDERAHLRALYEMHNRETRLEDGLPTDNVGHTGVVEHRLHITGGSRSSISISPPPNVKTIEHTSEEVAKKEDEDSDFDE